MLVCKSYPCSREQPERGQSYFYLYFVKMAATIGRQRLTVTQFSNFPPPNTPLNPMNHEIHPHVQLIDRHLFHELESETNPDLPRQFPNLVKGLEIKRPNQVWVSDITYVDTLSGFVFLSLVTDAYSRRDSNQS